MKITFFFLLFLLVALNNVCAQKNPALSKQLDSLAEADQKWRLVLAEPIRLHIDSSTHKVIGKKMKIADSLNLYTLRNILQRHGYPGYELVGRKSSHNFWLLIQHQYNHDAFVDSVLHSMKTQVDKKNASAYDYAYMLDKKRMLNKMPQEYGTQLKMNKDSTSYEPYMLSSPASVNERRKSIGLSTIEDYTEMKNGEVFGEKKK